MSNADSAPYLGPIAIAANTQDGVLLASHESVLTGSSPTQLLFSSQNRGEVDVIVTASNDVSELQERLRLIIVGMSLCKTVSTDGCFTDMPTHTQTDICTHYWVFTDTHTDKGEYGSVSIAFQTDRLPSNFDEWQQLLSARVIEAISKVNGINSDLVEVESIQRTQTRGQAKRSLQKRSNQLFLTVTINTLPREYSQSAIRHAKKVHVKNLN